MMREKGRMLKIAGLAFQFASVLVVLAIIAMLGYNSGNATGYAIGFNDDTLNIKNAETICEAQGAILYVWNSHHITCFYAKDGSCVVFQNPSLKQEQENSCNSFKAESGRQLR